MLDKIYDILVVILGESKQGGYDRAHEDYQFNCPCCRDNNDNTPDGKYNLEVLLSPARGLKFHCWKCGDTDKMKGSLSYLIKRYGGRGIYARYIEEINAIRSQSMYTLDCYEQSAFTDADEDLSLPQTFTPINLSTCTDRWVRNYLLSRKIDQSIIDTYRIGYTTWKEPSALLRNRIIIPSYDEFGTLNYWVGRDFTPDRPITPDDELGITRFVRPKYKNCTKDKKSIIFQESLINWNSSIILVEGAIDCLYFSGNAISMLGKKLSKESLLYRRLLERANGYIYIALDSDTHINETKSIYRLLNVGRLKGKIRYIRMNRYKDFGEAFEHEGRKGIVKLIKNAQTFSELDLICE